jgi:hypothetical protein
MDAFRVHLWNFGNGTTTATVDFGRSRSFIAWGSITFTDSRANYDRDNAQAIEVYRIDGNDPGWVGSGGDHLGSPGADANLRPGGWVGFGRRVTFRLRTMHVEDLESYGVGCVVTLD